MREKVYICEQIHQRGIALLEEHFDIVRGTGDIAAEAVGCSAMLVRSVRVTAQIMDKLPSLRVIAKHGMGVDNIDVGHATEKGILVVNAPYSNLNAVAEHIAMLLLAASKRAVFMDGLTRAGKFPQRTAYTSVELKGATLGVIGLGKISRLLVKKLAGFEMRVLAYDPFLPAGEGEALGVTMASSAEQVYAQADFVLVHTSLTADTFHMVGEEQFRRMKSTAFFLNASRGPVVDEAALIRALQQGRIAGAALDVFEKEPPAADNPLFAMDNVVLSPHNAALSDGALLNMAVDSAAGIVDYLTGKTPAYPVNPQVLEGRS